MNHHYRDAADGLREIASTYGNPAGHSIALATVQAKATLAVAAEQAKTNQHLELANLIAYAQLCKASRDGHASMEAMKAVQKAMGLPDDDDLDL